MDCVTVYKIHGVKMLGFFLSLTILGIFVIWICVKILIALGSQEQQENPQEELQEQEQESVAVELQPQELKRSSNVIGTYKDLQISQYVKIDGRTYVFESIAVEKSPGVYHTEQEGSYVVIDDHLLYREILA